MSILARLVRGNDRDRVVVTKCVTALAEQPQFYQTLNDFFRDNSHVLSGDFGYIHVPTIETTLSILIIMRVL